MLEKLLLFSRAVVIDSEDPFDKGDCSPVTDIPKYPECQVQELQPTEAASSVPTFNGYIKSSCVNVLIDSGASISLISDQCVKEADLKENKVNSRVVGYNDAHDPLIVTSYCTVPLAIENYDVEIEALVVPQSTLRYDIILGFDQMKRTNIYLAPDPQVQAKPIYYNNQIKELGTSTEICLRNPQQQVNQIQRGIVKVGSRPNFAQQRQKAIVECEQAMVSLSKRQRSRVLKALMIANYPYYWRCVKKVSQKQRTDN